jgi:hypothetical protein
MQGKDTAPAKDPAPEVEHDIDVEFKSGDYQLRVHVVECLELVPLTSAGIADPIVVIECCGQKIHTKQKKKCNSCVFDEFFYMQLSDMNQSKLEDANISINVLDCSSRFNSLVSNNVIGTFTMDLEKIYQYPGHELYRQWVPLFSSSRSGLTGKLLITAILLGPGDNAKVHDRKAEIIQEQKARRSAGAVISPNISSLLPKFAQKMKYLVLEIFRAEGVPSLNIASYGGSMYVHDEISVGVEFDCHEHVHTTKASLVKGQISNVEYMTALWLPFMDPSFSSRIQVRVWEHHMPYAKDEVDSSALCAALNLKAIKASMEAGGGGGGEAAATAGGGGVRGTGGTGSLSPSTENASSSPSGGSIDPTQLFWVNLYGPPVPETSSGSEKAKADMSMYPDTASAYRGRLLLRARVEEAAAGASSKSRAKDPLKCAITADYLTQFAVEGAGGSCGSKSNKSSSSGGGGGASPLPPLGFASGGSSRMSSFTFGLVSSSAEKEKDHAQLSRKSSLGGFDTSAAKHDPSSSASQFSITGVPYKKPKPWSERDVVAPVPGPKTLLSLPMPKTERYVLKALVYAGQSLPQGGFSKSGQFAVELRIMHRRLLTPIARMVNGYLMWEGDQAVYLQDWLELPSNPAMMPDLFLYLLNKNAEPICYKRFSLASLLAKPESEQFTTPVQWEILRADRTCSAIPKNVFPGAILLRIGFGKQSVAQLPTNGWNTAVTTQCKVYQVNIHLYSGRGLPPSDSSGLLDPYVQVRLGSNIYKTKNHYKTRNPMLMETLSFPMKLSVEDHLKPFMFLEVWDSDLGGDDFVGLIKLELAQADQRTDAARQGGSGVGPDRILRSPQWHPLRSKTGQDLMGQILLDVEILSFPVSGSLAPSPPLAPACTPWNLDMTIVGLRDLESVSMAPINRPYMSISLCDEVIQSVPPSKKPTSTDPNYLYHFEKEIMLPEIALYAPTINITVKDKLVRGIGLSGSIIGSVAVPLDYKMMSCMPNSMGVTSSAKRVGGAGGVASDAAGEATSVLEVAAKMYDKIMTFRSGNPFTSKDELINFQIALNDSCSSNVEDLFRTGDDEDDGAAAPLDVAAVLEAALEQMLAQDPEEALGYLLGRLALDCELEQVLGKPPFERYPLTIGSVASGVENITDTAFQQVRTKAIHHVYYCTI